MQQLIVALSLLCLSVSILIGTGIIKARTEKRAFALQWLLLAAGAALQLILFQL